MIGAQEESSALGKSAVLWRHRGSTDRAAPAVVLLHGAGGSHRSFDELVSALATHDVIVPALPGRAGSEGAAPETAEEAAAFVRALLASIDVDRYVLVGHSYGGAIAIEMALRDASIATPAVAGVLLVATGARLRVHPDILARARAAAAGFGPPVDVAALFGAGSSELVARFVARLADVPAEAALADWTAANRFDRLTDLAGIRAPLLAVSGENDALTPPRYARYLAEHVVGARFEVAPGAGHMLPIEEPERVAAYVESLMDGRAVACETPPRSEEAT